MNQEQLKNKILNFDFKKFGIQKFADENNIHYNTVCKYLKLYNVEYNSKKCWGIKREPCESAKIKSILSNPSKTNGKTKKPKKVFFHSDSNESELSELSDSSDRSASDSDDDSEYLKKIKKFSTLKNF